MCLAHTVAFNSNWHILLGCVAVVCVAACLLQIPEIDNRANREQRCAPNGSLSLGQRFLCVQLLKGYITVLFHAGIVIFVKMVNGEKGHSTSGFELAMLELEITWHTTVVWSFY